MKLNAKTQRYKPLELIHLIVGLGKPLALHSILNSFSAFMVRSFGSLIQIKGTIFAIVLFLNIKYKILIISTFNREQNALTVRSDRVMNNASVISGIFSINFSDR